MNEIGLIRAHVSQSMSQLSRANVAEVDPGNDGWQGWRRSQADQRRPPRSPTVV